MVRGSWRYYIIPRNSLSFKEIKKELELKIIYRNLMDSNGIHFNRKEFNAIERNLIKLIIDNLSKFN